MASRTTNQRETRCLPDAEVEIGSCGLSGACRSAGARPRRASPAPPPQTPAGNIHSAFVGAVGDCCCICLGKSEESVTKTREGPGRFASLMKWVGIATALLAFGSAVYGVVHAEAD